MPYKNSILFQLTTAPTDTEAAQSHIAGWSETVWSPLAPDTLDAITTLMNARARLLPKQARIIGYRSQVYTVQGNKLIPGGANSTIYTRPGIPANDCDTPQCAVLLRATANGTPNTRNFTLRGIPDSQISFGEYQPSGAFKASMTTYSNELSSGPWGFPGRDLAQVSQRVLGMLNGVVEVDNAIPGAAAGAFLRLLNVRDDNGKTISGSYPITLAAGRNYTLGGLAGYNVSTANGRARLDVIAMCQIASCSVARAVTRKVGGPFERYRGRRSKTTGRI
jgi:hypothetical protein